MSEKTQWGVRPSSVVNTTEMSEIWNEKNKSLSKETEDKTEWRLFITEKHNNGWTQQLSIFNDR